MKKRQKTIYCSQCKHSKYVNNPKTEGKNMLECNICKQAGVPKYLTTDCTYADNCSHFDPERLEAKQFKEYDAFKRQIRGQME